MKQMKTLFPVIIISITQKIKSLFQHSISLLTLSFLRPLRSSKPIANRKVNFLLLLTILIQSCGVEQTDWNFESGENGKLVVESILTTEQKMQEVLLSLSRNDLNGTPTPATGAEVTVALGGNEVEFLESVSEPGKYQAEQVGAVVAGPLYQLKVVWEGEEYTAQNQLVHVRPIPEIRWNQINEDSFRLVNTPGVFSANEQAMYEYYIDWSELTGNDSSRAKLVFYTFNSVDVNGIFRPDPEPVYFPKGSKILVKKYGLNDDFAAYLRALVMEVEWQGGLFDEASSSLPTNISNGGLGYFGVCKVLMDSVVVE